MKTQHIRLPTSKLMEMHAFCGCASGMHAAQALNTFCWNSVYTCTCQDLIVGLDFHLMHYMGILDQKTIR